MSGQAWYRHHARDFIDGVVGLGPDVIGAYIICLDLIYARGGPIKNDPRHIGGVMGCSSRLASSLIQKLIDAGKLVETDGLLHNNRATDELENQAKQTRKLSEAGAKGGRTRVENERHNNENSYLDEATLNQQRGEERRIKTPPTEGQKTPAPDDLFAEDAALAEAAAAEAERVAALAVAKQFRDDCASITAEWNAMAATHGLPKVSVLSDDRKAKLRTRLDEHGRQAFTEAISNVAKSPMCRGENTRGWRANFDFLLQPSSFLKIIEGNYDDRSNPASNLQPRNGAGQHTDRLAAGLRLLDEFTGQPEAAASGYR